jgi:hypothetical protein
VRSHRINASLTSCRLIIAALMIVMSGCERTVPPHTPSQPKQTTAKPVQPPRESSPHRRDNQSTDAATSRDEPTENDPAGMPAVLAAAASPAPIHRPDDLRPKYDDRRLGEAGIRLYESKRLKLYTDIEAETARTLPPVIDAVYGAWVEYFGELPPDRAGSEFQMTGYLIGDEALFREAGLVPEDLPMFEHGRHRRNEFWMREQQYEYFRRHLLIHEATHCFMTFMPGVNAPVWYIEGMAEYFATHHFSPDGSVNFRVMPTSSEDFAGWGRIKGIRDEFSAGRSKSIRDILTMQPIEFLKPEPYAWSWALCQFLDAHPRYRERFRKLGGHLQGSAFPDEFEAAFHGDAPDLNTEWTLFVVNLQYGFEATRAAIDFQPGRALTTDRPAHRIDIAADRGWQSSGVLLEAGQTYEIAATGRFTLADRPKPWTSEPQGISFRYFDRRPLGRLIGCLRAEEGDAGAENEPMLKVFDIGRGRSFEASQTGTLYLRVNDAWNSLSDNRGQIAVEFRRTSSAN